MSTDSKLTEYLNLIDTKIANIENINNLEYLLKLKANLVLALRQISGGEGGVASGTQRTPTFITSSTSGTVTAGKKSVSIHNFGNADGTLLGTSFPAGASISFTTDGADTLGAIAFNATGTTYLIVGVE